MKNIAQVLQNSTLSKIVQRANELNDLNQKIHEILPKEFANLYRIRNLVDNQLVFEVPNAIVKQGLELRQRQLLEWIKQDFPEIDACIFKVNPSFKSY